MAIFGNRVKNVWNAFLGRDPTPKYGTYSFMSEYRPDRPRTIMAGKKQIVSAIYNKIAVYCASIDIKHVRLGEEGRYKETIDDSLNWCLTRSANIDQTGRSMIQDAVFSMLDEGVVAIVPVDTDEDPDKTDSYNIESLRVGKIMEWFPTSVRVEVYDEQTGQRKQVVLNKRYIAIVENPFFSIMNEPNSVAQRLQKVLGQLERMNDESVSGKLDLIVQLPYSIRSDARRKQAEQRRKDIVAQLTGNQYGIAYTDGSERIIQLNRPLENNLWEQAKELQAQLFNQLGFTEAIYNGTADEATMLNFEVTTIEPILTAITEEMERKWLSRTAVSQNQAIRFYKNPFRLVPVNKLAEMVDKFTRNEIMSSNEFRAVMGLKPSSDPKADQLINSNLNHPEEKKLMQKKSGGEEKTKEILSKLQNQ